MRKFPGSPLCTTAGALAVLSVPATARAGAPPSPEASRVAFAPRHHVVQQGGFVHPAADTVVGHRVAHGADAFQASADVRRLVRDSGSGLCTVARTTIARGRPAAGAGGRVGPVAYDGDRGRAGDALTFSAGHRRTPVALGAPASPTDGVPNSTTNEPGAVPARRVPAYADTLGYDADVSDLGPALRHGGDQPGFRLVPHADAAWAGAHPVAVDARW
ncbi:hypothetical protein D9753_23100 [Streptomyces dangxiongensis]|uniref:Uncharacterized protein n=1 Tax=Streptomyces dangxiongensis TaxID=1442032 RepID=A0A3G2JFW6_9ACTN|nr:hypothetical protein [Streptomyces dangxiongensis]AYN41288.1 hypothetical protein D9753_23100 [Streptomyces dangxiongensis]